MNNFFTKFLIAVGCLAIVAFVIFLDFFLFPLILQMILSWFGFNLALWQCMVIMFVVYVIRNWA